MTGILFPILFFLPLNYHFFFIGDDGSEDYEEPELVMEKIEEEPLTTWEREHQSYQKLCRGEKQVPER